MTLEAEELKMVETAESSEQSSIWSYSSFETNYLIQSCKSFADTAIVTKKSVK